MITRDSSVDAEAALRERGLSPSAEYEIWLRLVRGETTIAKVTAEAEPG